MAFDGERMGKELVETVRSFVTRSLDPIREHIRGLSGRVDKHFQRIEALEARVAALERLPQKAAPERSQRPVRIVESYDR